MATTAWLTTNEDAPELDGIRLGTLDDGTREATIPAAPMGVGGRTSAVPGIFHDPRVRPYSDKLAQVTGPNDPRPITFPVRLEGPDYDTIRRNWSKIENLLNRAEEASSPWPRGVTGVYYIEQWEDATEWAVWDVISGVPADQDLNLPGIIMQGMILQLAVRPFARGLPRVVPYGLTVPNPAVPFIEGVSGDTDSILEMRLKDVSTGGYNISRVRIGVRGYQSMRVSDFTPFYQRADSITTGVDFAEMGSQTIDAGLHQTGLHAVHAIINDSSAIIGTPHIQGATTPNAGGLATGLYQYLWFGKDVSDRWGPPSNLLSLTAKSVVQGASVVAAVQPIMIESFSTGEPSSVYPGPRHEIQSSIQPDAVFSTLGDYVDGSTYSMLTTPDRCRLTASLDVVSAMTGDSGAVDVLTIQMLIQATPQAWPASGVLSFRVNVLTSDVGYVVPIFDHSLSQISLNGFLTDIAGSVALPSDGVEHTIELTAALEASDTIYFRAAIDGVPVNVTRDTFQPEGDTLDKKLTGFAVFSLIDAQAVLPATIPTGVTTSVVDVYSMQLADGILGGAIIAGGSTNQIDAEALDNATDNWLFWMLSTTDKSGSTVTGPWYSLDLGAVTSYTHTEQIPAGAILGVDPPLGPLEVQPAQLQLRSGGGSLLYPQRLVPTQYANGVDELVNLGICSLPGGARPDYGPFPSNGVVAVDGRTGGANTDTLQCKGLILFPMDGVGRQSQIVASAGEGGNPLTQQCIWFVGVNRFGYAYCMLFDAGTDAFLGYVPISGRIALHEGDNQLVVVLERQDTSGRYICDLENLKVQVGYRNVTRWHLGPVPGGPF